MQSWIYTCICIIQLDISVQGPARGQQIYLGLTLGEWEATVYVCCTRDDHSLYVLGILDVCETCSAHVVM